MTRRPARSPGPCPPSRSPGPRSAPGATGSRAHGEQPLDILGAIPRDQRQEQALGLQFHQPPLQFGMPGSQFDALGAIFPEDPAVKRLVQVQGQGLDPRPKARREPAACQLAGQEHAGRVAQAGPAQGSRAIVVESIAHGVGDRPGIAQPHAREAAEGLGQRGIEGPLQVPPPQPVPGSGPGSTLRKLLSRPASHCANPAGSCRWPYRPKSSQTTSASAGGPSDTPPKLSESS